MLTKAIIQSVNYSTNKCTVRIPLFETSASTEPIFAEALISTPPGLCNNFFEGDVVFVGFEENKINKPIILGKLFRRPDFETEIRGGNVTCGNLKVKSTAQLPLSTTFEIPTVTDGSLNDKKYLGLSSVKALLDTVLTLSENAKDSRNLTSIQTHVRVTPRVYQESIFTETEDSPIEIVLETSQVYSDLSKGALFDKVQDSYFQNIDHSLMHKLRNEYHRLDEEGFITQDERKLIDQLSPIPVKILHLDSGLYSLGSITLALNPPSNIEEPIFIVSVDDKTLWCAPSMAITAFSHYRSY